jgi:Na+:H+ antiporter, NhaA family
MPRNDPVPSRLPRQRVNRLVEPVARFLRIEAMSGVVLLVATAAALILANSRWAEPFLGFWATPVGIRFGSVEIEHSLQHAINDGLMTLFFFVVGLEIKREVVMGELRGLRVAALPIAAALGGMLVPAALYLALQAGAPGQAGWGVVMATDIAFVVGCLAVLGQRVPRSLRVFVLSLAIIDDIGAILVIAIGYAAHLNLLALALGGLGVGGVLGLRYLGVRSVPLYFLIGIPAWFAVYLSGIHPTIVGVVLGLLTPAHPWVAPRRLQAIVDRVNAYLHRETQPPAEALQAAHQGAHHEAHQEVLRSVEFAAREAISPLERLETTLHPWVGFLIMPLFALANAGVPLTSGGLSDPIVPAVIVGLALGKPIGILGGSWIAVRLGIAARPEELRWPVIAAAGLLCGIGFTMALFIASLAFGVGPLSAAKLGILVASFASAVAGLAFLFVVLPPSPTGAARG